VNLAPNPFLHASYSCTSADKPPINGLWPLCFHGLTNCFSRKPLPLMNICVAPRVCWSAHHSQFSFPSASAATRLFSMAYRLLDSLASLFRVPFLCFQQLADSFGKIPGGGVPLLDFARFRRSNSGDQDLQIVYAAPNPPDVPTFRHSAKIHATPL
jgi:hypothetical protein